MAGHEGAPWKKNSKIEIWSIIQSAL